MTLATLLRPKIAAAFADQCAILHEGLEPFLTFEPKWADFGALELFDDEDEVTIYYGIFTHAHYGCFDEGLTDTEKAEHILTNILADLSEVFADRSEFYAGVGGGGFGPVGSHGKFSLANLPGVRRGLWSRAIGYSK